MSVTSPDLVRRPPPGSVQEIIDEEDRKLAERAFKLLGYNGLRHHIEKQDKAANGGALEPLLTKADLEPFDMVGVERYKRKKTKKALWNDIDWFWANIVWRPLALLTLALACIALWTGFHYGTRAMPTSDLVLWAPGMCVAIGLLALDIFLWRRFIFSPEVHAGWALYLTAGYEMPIPTRIQQIACDLKEACPGATFYLDELRLTKKERAWRLDPFLVVETPQKMRYWIAVWDEVGFKG